MNREIYFSCSLHELFSPPSKLFTFPWCNGSLIYAQSFIGNHKVAVNSQHLRKAFASRASTNWIVEIEKIGNRFFKRHSIQFEPVVKMNRLASIYFDID